MAEGLYEKLNEMGKRWICDSPENHAAYEQQYYAFINCVMSQYGSILGTSNSEDTLANCSVRESLHDALIDVCMDVRRFYDPQRGELGAFFSSRLSKKRINHADDYKHSAYAEPTIKSLDEPVKNEGDDREQNIGDFVPDPTARLGERAMAQELYLELVTAVIRLKQSSSPKSPQRIDYFKMWLAEKTTFLAKSVPELLPREKERDVFSAMDCGYLDYFTYADFGGTKDYSFRRLTNAELNPPDLKWNSSNWLPARIPIGYLNQQGETAYDSTISSERKAFMKFIGENIEPTTGVEII